jgi:hypothetical protein
MVFSKPSRIRRRTAADNGAREWQDVRHAMAQHSETTRNPPAAALASPTALALCAALMLLAATAPSAQAQRLTDSTFDAAIARAAYVRSHPRVLIDQAHDNLFTASGRYRPFAELMANDGYAVAPNRARFSARTLRGARVLVIADATSDSVSGAFTPAECAVVREWVRAGGALALIADHAPMGAAAARLAREFGVSMNDGPVNDPSHSDPETGNPGTILFSREAGMLGQHAIVDGRNPSERVDHLMTYGGQSLFGPPGATALFKFAHGAHEFVVDAGAQVGADSSAHATFDPSDALSITGRAQGLALAFGRGRVVVLGDAAMLTAQLSVGRMAQSLGHPIAIGMNRVGVDNRQFALNVMHWLTRLLP